MSIYADTNFLAFCYLAGDGIPAGQRNSDRLPVMWLTRLEVINAFEQSVLTGYGVEQIRVSREFASVCQQQFRDDLRVGAALRAVQVSEDALASQFEELALRHTALHGFRTYDILHVSAALLLRCERFWSFDQRASKLARLEGLKVLR